MIARLLGALLAALLVLAAELPDRSRVLLALASFLLLAGWPWGRRVDGHELALTTAAWVATALPVAGLALRLDLDRAATPWPALSFAAMGLALVAALAACAQRAAGGKSYAATWSLMVPGLAILAWAWDHGTAAESSWPLWSTLSPLAWTASQAADSSSWASSTTASPESGLGPARIARWLGPWLGVTLLWSTARLGEKR